MRLIYIAPLLCLMGCSTLDTPQSKYYALTVAVTEVANITEKYVDTCLNALPVDDKCHDKLPAINAGAKALQSNARELDKIFVSGDSAYYNLSLTLTENAINNLKQLVGVE
jgi:hypothetical protein